MMQEEYREVIRYEPDRWFVIFKRASGTDWINRWVPGRFKHVLAIGWVDSLKVWVSYEVMIGRTVIVVRPDDDETQQQIMAARADGKTLMVEAKVRKNRFSWFGWCVPSVAHLVGSQSGALLCDRLWSDLLAEGATEMSDVECI